MGRRRMGTQHTGARVEQLHHIEMETIPPIHLMETLRQRIDIRVDFFFKAILAGLINLHNQEHV